MTKVLFSCDTEFMTVILSIAKRLKDNRNRKIYLTIRLYQKFAKIMGQSHCFYLCCQRFLTSFNVDLKARYSLRPITC